MASKLAKNPMHAFSIFGKYIITVAFGTLFVHCVITILTIYIFQKPTDAGFLDDYISHLFSYRMLPTIVTYSIFLSIAFYFYNKTKKIMHFLNQQEIKKEKTRAILKTSQNTTGTIIDHISVYNSEIMEWLIQKEQKGEIPPEKIVDANRKISMALITLSKKSFLYPYVNSDTFNYDDLISSLEKNILDDLNINKSKN